MRIKIFTLPVTSLDMPHLAVPTLVGFLKNGNHEVSHVDLNTKAINSFLNKKYVQECYEKIIIRDRYGAWIKKHGYWAYEKIDRAVDYFRNSKSYNSKEYSIWSSVLKMSMAIVSYQYDSVWSLKNINYNLKLDNPSDYFNAIKNSNCNLFEKIFQDEIKELDNNKIDVIGLSISYVHQLLTALHFAKMIKSKYKDIKIVLGGSYLSHLNDIISEFIKYDNLIDLIILDSGEIPFKAFLENMGSREDIEKYCTIECEYNGRYVIKEKKTYTNKNIFSYIEEFHPDFSEVDFKSYLSSKITIPIITSYGCYHGKCTFCTHFKSYGNKVLLMSINKIRNLLEEYCNKYNAQVIYFVDECISAFRLKEISKMIIDNNISIEWLVETRIDKKFDNRIVKIMSESGCKMLSFGIETVNDETLIHMNKGFLFSDVLECISKFKSTNIAVAATIIVGYPWESYENAVKTLDQVENEMNLDFFGVSVFGLHKNSLLYNKAEEYGINILRTESSMQLNFDFNLKNELYNKNKFIKLFDEFHKRNNISEHFALISKIIGRTHLISFNIDKVSYHRNRNKY